jgi:hypothetical protein
MGPQTPAISKRFFAVTSLGSKRWYWVVWPSLEELRASDEVLLHIGEGYENSKAEAVERALDLAGPDGEWIAAKYAKAHQRSKSGRGGEPGKRPAAGSSAAPDVQEFLYRDTRDVVTGRWRSVPHRVVRRTSTYVYVEQRPHMPDDRTPGWLHHDRQTFRLDRRTLERERYAFLPLTAYMADSEEPMFFSKPHHERAVQLGPESTAYLDALKLTWPCTLAEVKSAYRRLAKSAHPDGGGSHADFLALQTAYQQALRMCITGDPYSG